MQFVRLLADNDTVMVKTSIRLTESQLEVLRLKAEGFTSKEVAEKLLKSKRTIDFHLAESFQRLGVTNLVAALNVARAGGLI